MKEKIEIFKKFIDSGIWSADISKVSRQKRFVIQFFRIFSLGVKGFKEDKLNVRASALTYFSMLSIIPVFALAFGIAKGFGLEEFLKEEITKSMSGQKEVLTYILKFASSMLDSTKGGLVAGIGLILLFWSVMKLLINIEESFNTVWDVEKSRSILRKFTDYFSIMMFAPILLIMASSATIFISTQLTSISNHEMFSFASPLLLKFAQIIPLIIIWSAFTLLYLVMPNTKVNFKSAIIGGIIAGTIFQIFQTFYVYFQGSATRMNAIYGSFVALPLFLIWLQISWFVVLLGTEISFAVQSVKTKGKIIGNENLSIAFQKKLALFISKIIVDDFAKGGAPISKKEIIEKVNLPHHIIEYILQKLIEAKIISQIYNKKAKFTYQPAESINNICISKTVSKFENSGVDNSKIINSKEYKIVAKFLNEMENVYFESEKNLILKDIIVSE